MVDEAAVHDEGQAVRVLLVSGRDWFASALQAVLEPEGFSFIHAWTEQEAFELIPEVDPEILIIDEGLAGMPAPEFCQEALSAGLGSSVPILVYSANYWHETEQAETIRAGAWDVIREPIRSRLLVAKLRRLLQLRRLIEFAEENSLADQETGLYNLAGLVHSLPIVGSLAERSGAPLSCAVIGPTQPAESSSELKRQGRSIAVLVKQFTRTSDLCATVGGADVALVAYNADANTAAAIVQRLSERSADRPESVGAPEPLSAGIVTLPLSDLRERDQKEAVEGVLRRSAANRFTSLSRLADAQSALVNAREAGGGIRIAAPA
jgi:PleD family two-component response regulator